MLFPIIEQMLERFAGEPARQKILSRFPRNGIIDMGAVAVSAGKIAPMGDKNGGTVQRKLAHVYPAEVEYCATIRDARSSRTSLKIRSGLMLLLPILAFINVKVCSLIPVYSGASQFVPVYHAVFALSRQVSGLCQKHSVLFPASQNLRVDLTQIVLGV